jgi:hypothetical protein
MQYRGYLSFVILALVWAQPARAESFVYLATSSGGMRMSVDRDSLRPSRPLGEARRFEAMQLSVLFTDTRGETERAQFSFSCRSRTYAILSYKKVRANRTRSQDWVGADIAVRYKPIEPASLNETALTFACNGGKMPAPAPLDDGVRSEDGPQG